MVEKVVEVPAQKVPAQKVTEPVIEKDPEELSLVPPPEDEEFISPVVQKAKEPKNIATAVSNSITVDGKRCWGGIVRRLRTTPNKTILWVACQEMTASVDGNTLTIYASAENEKKLLLQNDNFETLLSIAKGFGVENIKVEIRSGSVSQEDPIEKAKAFFGDTLKVEK